MDKQLAILLDGLDAIQPDLAQSLRDSFAAQVDLLNDLPDDKRDAAYRDLVKDMVQTLRRVFVNDIHTNSLLAVLGQ